MPSRGLLSSYNHGQPNSAYNLRKVPKSKLDPIIPMIVSAYPKPVQSYSKSIRKSKSNSSLIATRIQAEKGLNVLDNNKKQSSQADSVQRTKALEQINEVLDNLNTNTIEFGNKPVGHGNSNKENIESLKKFVRPVEGYSMSKDGKIDALISKVNNIISLEK